MFEEKIWTTTERDFKKTTFTKERDMRTEEKTVIFGSYEKYILIIKNFMTEIRLLWETWKTGWSIYIPYEINHDFFLAIQFKIKDSMLDLERLRIAWPDYWPWWTLEWERLDKYINDCDYFQDNLDTIIQIIPLPKNMWEGDDWYMEWFIWNSKTDNSVEGENRQVSKKDIVLLLWLLKKKAQEAKEKWIPLCFSWD